MVPLKSYAIRPTLLEINIQMRRNLYSQNIYFSCNLRTELYIKFPKYQSYVVLFIGFTIINRPKREALLSRLK